MVPSFKCERNNFIIDKGCHVVGDKFTKWVRMQKGENTKG
jgi:hypothetical protein